MASTVVVWGNCQADPIAQLLAEPLSRHGLSVLRLPPVYLITAPQADEVRRVLTDAAFLISQPIRDDYRIPGLGTEQLASLLPPTGRVITFPVSFHTGPFPYQVNANGADGERVLAPITDYHDLRLIVAASRGLDTSATVAWWPEPSQTAVREISAASEAELQAREADLDVRTSDLVVRPEAMWTISHPTNATLGRVAQRLLTAMGIDDVIVTPEREFLAERCAPIEPAVASALGWTAPLARSEWTVGGESVPLTDVAAAHLDFYRNRPDVVSDSLRRYAGRLRTLELAQPE